ncbi:NHLP-related RiPP peptide [Xanthomonas cassavae CFBP 4642]|uniref:NHLP-related RiPP peptide n=1 Tax=Xanthomonas cassavae CFBP 4642 TaxID=1219375 RepID=A0ABS8HIW7_9XANT|nr:NHLP-related RiPP peptide [Xanthomonas cassavae]MCC4621075.1 NHLP-related RiPP peptide [Xanthomonas cassavae CFBP 4642]
MALTSDTAHPAIDASIADKLLELLSSDDAFRDCFQCNPAQALAQIGAPGAIVTNAAPGPGDAYYCMTSSQLASKEDIAQARAELHSQLTEKTNHTVIFAFESESIRSTLLRK